MPKPNTTLRDRLSRESEINISVKGRKSGREISIPIWFVFDQDQLFLLPVQGSDTQWYKNVLKNPLFRIEGGGAQRLNSRRFLSLIPRRCPLWLRSSGKSTGPRT
ncbi:MAG: nitroreductase family deazaflavin-dependent oxidoreductase [Acidobacteriaceae bacterium]|nr:nitroreductase family deazaflavin-dependent oxidoreductase [Acidobacteriaceae bacterium]